MLKKYYYLTKPGIIYGNAITTTAGFLLASAGQINWPLFFATLAGISFIIASGCVLNNYLDKDLDAHMERTKNRALVSGSVSHKNAIIYAIILGLIGIGFLYLFTNFLTLFIAALGHFIYVAIYSPLKRSTTLATLIGSIAGAVPPLVGYCAVSAHFDTGAIILFAIMALWQMPHFYSIAIFRQDEYAKAYVPVLPIKKGIMFTKINILGYIIAFSAAAFLLFHFGYEGMVYLVITSLLSLIWLLFSIAGFWANENKSWARKMFIISLIVITTFSITISIASILKYNI